MEIVDNNEAVSAVIAVILLVAITVILTAIIATVLLGMSANIPKTKMVTGIVSQAEANQIVVTYVGGQDQPTCTGVRWVITESSGLTHVSTMGFTSPSITTPLEAGTSMTFAGNFISRDHIVATAYFMDGTQQVVVDNFI